MQGEIYDYPTRLLVVSETDGDHASYLVDLCAYRVGSVFNGACQCKSFMYRCRPQIKLPGNDKICRCKHIRWARENALDFILPHLAAADPNPPEDHL